MWRCAACGGENPAETKFCGHCGAPVVDTPATAATEPPAYDTGAASALRSFVTGSVADRLVETGGQLPEERRLVTALFADVSGFTLLADRLDPEELIEVIDPVITTLSDVVGRYDGYVEKYAGDANAHQQQMFGDSLHAALTLEEVRAIVTRLGFEASKVQQTTDRHWTWASSR